MSAESTYGQVIVAANPCGGSVGRLGNFIDTMADWPHGVRLIETGPTIADSEAILASEPIKPQDVLVVYSGDGALHQFIPALVNLGLANVCIAAPGGTKNNTARAHNGRRSIPYILDHGVPRRSYLMQTSWQLSQTPNSIVTVESVDDVAFMAPVTALERVEEQKFANSQKNAFSRYISEVQLTVGAVANHPTFTAVFEEGEEQELASLLYAHNYFLAGDGRTHVTTFGRLREEIALGKQGKLRTSLTLGSLALGVLRGEIRDKPTTFTVRTHDGGPLPVEADGELGVKGQRYRVPDGAEVTVEVTGERHYNTLSTTRH